FPAGILEACFEEHGLVSAVVDVELEQYLGEIAPYLAEFDLDQQQLGLLRALGTPWTCAFCVHPECLGDDLALRSYLLGFQALLPLDAVVGLPSIRPRQYTWLQVEKPAGRKKSDVEEKPVLKAAIVIRSNPQMGGAFLFSEATRPNALRYFEEITGLVWRLKFEKMQELLAAGHLLETWWHDMSVCLFGWFFGWQTDILVVGIKTLEAAEWAAREYDVLIFVGFPNDVDLLPPVQGPGPSPVRLLMPHEPFYLLNWIIGETDHPDITSFETSPAQHKQRRWAWFRRHQVCPVVLEQFDLPWVIEHAAYPVVKTSSDDWDFRVDLRRPVDALPSHLAEIAPVLLAPQMIRWHVPLYKSLSHTADSQFRLRQAHAGRKMVMIDGRGCNTSELLWMDSELKQRGFAVLRVDTERRHGRHIFVQPRAMMRSLFEEHLPELAACQYLVHVTPKASAGQLIVEAALLGVLPLGSPHKMFARLLLPPELRAATLAEALATIDSLEAAGAERTQLLRATLRGRAERLVGAEDLPPLASYLRLLGSLREPGIPSAAISALCAPRNNRSSMQNNHNNNFNNNNHNRNNNNNNTFLTTSEPGQLQGFWRFAAGKSCGQGSVGKDEVQDHKAVSPRECAEYCKTVGGRAFVYEETRRLCSVFFRCVLKQPEQWNTDVFVLEEALHSMDDTPIVSLRPTSAQVVEAPSKIYDGISQIK
ncbi:unnamed protein product, partial [Polarella glacialis]